jgi:hypothetical protein
MLNMKSIWTRTDTEGRWCRVVLGKQPGIVVYAGTETRVHRSKPLYTVFDVLQDINDPPQAHTLSSPFTPYTDWGVHVSDGSVYMRLVGNIWTNGLQVVPIVTQDIRYVTFRACMDFIESLPGENEAEEGVLQDHETGEDLGDSDMDAREGEEEGDLDGFVVMDSVIEYDTDVEAEKKDTSAKRFHRRRNRLVLSDDEDEESI